MGQTNIQSSSCWSDLVVVVGRGAGVPTDRRWALPPAAAQPCSHAAAQPCTPVAARPRGRALVRPQREDENSCFGLFGREQGGMRSGVEQPGDGGAVTGVHGCAATCGHGCRWLPADVAGWHHVGVPGRRVLLAHPDIDVRLRRRRECCHSAAPPSAFSSRFQYGWNGGASKMPVSPTAAGAHSVQLSSTMTDAEVCARMYCDPD